MKKDFRNHGVDKFLTRMTNNFIEKSSVTAKNLDLYKQVLTLERIALDKKLELVESVLGKPWGDVVGVAMQEYDKIAECLDDHLSKQDY
jgi:hypothetical protein